MSTSWSTALRAAGFRVTRPRLAVAEALAELGGHHSADDVLAHLADTDRPLPRASVYNVLDTLVEAGIAAPAYHGPGRALYEIGSEPHDHFYCTSCDHLADVERSVGVDGLPAMDGTTVTEVAVVYRGTCAACD